MRADCKVCQSLQREYDDIREAYLALHKKIQTDDTAKNNPERAATLDQGLRYIENQMANLSDAIRRHGSEAHSDVTA
jgi:hypothetical protein